MYHLRTVKSRATRALATAVVAGGGLTVGSVALMLAGTGPAAAAEFGTTLSAPVSYSCDFSPYGQGLAPLTVNATLKAPSTVTLGTALTVTLVTSGTAVPAATSAGLPMMSYLNLTGVATLSGPGTLDASLAGRSQYIGAAAGSMTRIPSLTGTGTVTPQTAGTMSLTAPSSIHLVPSGASAAKAPVTCTAASAVQVQVTVAASLAGTGTGSAMGTLPAGTQLYTCAVQVNVATGGPATTSVVPMRLSAVGPQTMATDNQVALTSEALGEPMAGAAATAASASLGLEGASNGSIPLVAGMHGGDLALTGQWQPARAGLFRLVAPHRFQVTMRTTTAVRIVLVCTAATVTTTTTAVRVTRSAMPNAATAGMAAGKTNPSTAASAPDTGAGGSLHAPVDVTLLAVGVIAVTAGVVTMLLAIRRRGRAMTS